MAKTFDPLRDGVDYKGRIIVAAYYPSRGKPSGWGAAWTNADGTWQVTEVSFFTNAEAAIEAAKSQIDRAETEPQRRRALIESAHDAFMQIQFDGLSTLALERFISELKRVAEKSGR